MPWVRPMVGVCLNSMARRRSTASRAAMPARMSSEASADLQRLRRIHDVVRGEPIMQPAGFGVESWALRVSATAVVKAMTSCFTSASISCTRAAEQLARVAMASAAEAGITPSSASTVLAADSTRSQQRYLFSSVQMLPIAGRV